jgi:hypothetical protein
LQYLLVHVRVLYCGSGTREKVLKNTGIRPTMIVEDDTMMIIVMLNIITTSFPGVRVFEHLLVWTIQTKASFALLCPSRQILTSFLETDHSRFLPFISDSLFIKSRKIIEVNYLDANF